MGSGHHNRGHGFERHPTRLMVLMFSDVVGSVELKSRLGNAVYARLLAKHDAIFHAIVGGIPQAAINNDLGDGFLTRFATTGDAVIAALRFRRQLDEMKWDPEPITVRIGLHLGEVAEQPDAEGRPKLIGLAADLSARIMGLALPGQILMTRAMFDNARQAVREFAPAQEGGEKANVELDWRAHGPYLFKGAVEPMEVFEVGIKGIAPLKAPPDSEKAERAVNREDADLYGWRPAIDLPIVSRENWILSKRIGVNADGESWIAEHQKSKSRRVFKFCFDPEQLRRFKRELKLFRQLRDELGNRADIVKLLDVQLDNPPYYLESEYAEHGNLAQWAATKGGLLQIPLETRLRLMEQIAEAVDAAHSVWILHKCIRPSNVLIFESRDGTPRVGVCDFGIGDLADQSRLERSGITMKSLGESAMLADTLRERGAIMYLPPEVLNGQDFSTKGDVYGLGVLLYQMVVGDLHRVPAQGWERDVADPLLRDDIAQCIHGQPGERMNSAGELATRLGAHEERGRRRYWWLGVKIAMAVGVVAIVVGLLVLALVNWDSHAQ